MTALGCGLSRARRQARAPRRGRPRVERGPFDDRAPEARRRADKGDRLRGDAAAGARSAWARNARTADCTTEAAIETASARAGAPVTSSATAAIRVIYERCSERIMDR